MHARFFFRLVRTRNPWCEPNKAKESGWCLGLQLAGHMTYLNGFLHVTTWRHVIAAMDTQCQEWRTIGSPSRRSTDYDFVSHSQGRLIYVDVQRRQTGVQLVIYALGEGHDSEEWTLRQHLQQTTK